MRQTLSSRIGIAVGALCMGALLTAPSHAAPATATSYQRVIPSGFGAQSDDPFPSGWWPAAGSSFVSAWNVKTGKTWKRNFVSNANRKFELIAKAYTEPAVLVVQQETVIDPQGLAADQVTTKLAAFATASGKPMWNRTVSSSSKIFTGNKSVHKSWVMLADKSARQICAILPQDGTQGACFPYNNRDGVWEGAVIGDIVVMMPPRPDVGRGDNSLFGYDARTGAVRWSLKSLPGYPRIQYGFGEAPGWVVLQQPNDNLTYGSLSGDTYLVNGSSGEKVAENMNFVHPTSDPSILVGMNVAYNTQPWSERWALRASTSKGFRSWCGSTVWDGDGNRRSLSDGRIISKTPDQEIPSWCMDGNQAISRTKKPNVLRITTA